MENNISLEEQEQPPSTPAARFVTVSNANVAESLIDFADEGESPQGKAFYTPEVKDRQRSSRPAFRRTLLPQSEKIASFRKRFYPDISDGQWTDWRWQLRSRITSLKDLERVLRLSDDERNAVLRHQGPLPVSITPYYAALLDVDDPLQPLRRSVVMSEKEYHISPEESADPLGEEHDSPLPNLVHRYPDRVLFLVTPFCSVYCRYCTRSRMVGRQHERPQTMPALWGAAIHYIESHSEIRDVLLSGGDPLTLSDNRLDRLLQRLRRIPHVEVIRIGSKVPAVLPYRITPSLINVLRRYHPLYMSIHFTHPDELTAETAHACGRLADAGIPLGSQTVLLKGINDDVQIMRRLNQGLMKLRVRPYYLYQCDPVPGTSHFRTSVQKGLEIIAGLRGHTSGYAVPHFVIDAPGGGGKIPLLPDYVIGRDGCDILMRNYEGQVFRYPDTLAANDEEGK